MHEEEEEVGFGEAETVKRGHVRAPPRDPAASRGGHVRLLVVGEGSCETVVLPDSGEVIVGRAPGSGVRIDDASISRKHAVIRIADSKLDIEDLESANGTFLREQKVPAKKRIEVHPGDAIEVGGWTLIVQRDPATTERLRRFLPHGYFEARVESECARAERTGIPFAVGRLHVSRALSGKIVEESLAAELRSDEAAAAYGPGEYEFMLTDTTPDHASQVAKRIASRLESADPHDVPRIGVAVWGRDGRTPEVLLAKACDDVRVDSRPHRPASADRLEKRSAAAQKIVVEEPSMLGLHRLLERVASGGISVLVLGETGVGKEVIAETIHKRSPRAERPFVRLNCAALSESLIESELFGHEKGAFTGAIGAKPGLLETAEGGTVFLDEVGELQLSTQVKLLRVVEERMVMRVGGLKPRPIDVRIVSATNRDLEAEVAAGRFRQDLYFRLNGITVTVPPLRDRPSEIPVLARVFVAQIATRDGIKVAPAISNEAMSCLLKYRWPGNIRELRNAIERAVLLAGDEPIRPEHLPLEKMSPAAVVNAPPRREAALGADLETHMQAFERDRIIEALDRAGGNQTQAAKMLGIARRTLIKRLDQYKIERPRKEYED